MARTRVRGSSNFGRGLASLDPRKHAGSSCNSKLCCGNSASYHSLRLSHSQSRQQAPHVQTLLDSICFNTINLQHVIIAVPSVCAEQTGKMVRLLKRVRKQTTAGRLCATCQWEVALGKGGWRTRIQPVGHLLVCVYTCELTTTAEGMVLAGGVGEEGGRRLVGGGGG